MRLAVYTRVSTSIQVTGESLQDQENDCRKWAEGSQHTIRAVFHEEGISGTAEDRPALTELLDALERGDVRGVLLRDMDRLAREVTTQEAILAQLWARGAYVFTMSGGQVQQDDPDDPYRTAMRQMKGVFNGLERRMIRKRMNDGKRNKSARGGQAQGPAPYGWRTESGELIPVWPEQETLRVMLQMYHDGATQQAITAHLNEEGYPTQRGGWWRQPTVSRVLAKELSLTEQQVTYRRRQLRDHSG